MSWIGLGVPTRAYAQGLPNLDGWKSCSGSLRRSVSPSRRWCGPRGPVARATSVGPTSGSANDSPRR